MTWPKTVAWSLVTVLAVLIGAYALAYFVFPEMVDPDFRRRFDVLPWSSRSHIIPGGLALILGAFQFHTGLRAGRPVLHRFCGRFYVVCVLIAALGGLLLAWHAPHSVATKLGFASLAVVWFYATLMGWRAARGGNIALHRQWMVRSYALTLAAVTLRVQLPLLQAVHGLSFDAAYAVVAWFSWVPNLVIAEWFRVHASARAAAVAAPR